MKISDNQHLAIYQCPWDLKRSTILHLVWDFWQETESFIERDGHTVCTMVMTLPLRPAHSMSKLRMRTGAIFNHSPSQGYETSSFHAMSTSIWQCDLRHGDVVFPALLVDGRTRYFPAGNSTQLHPIILQSTMNLLQTINKRQALLVQSST